MFDFLFEMYASVLNFMQRLCTFFRYRGSNSCQQRMSYLPILWADFILNKCSCNENVTLWSSMASVIHTVGAIVS